MTARSKKQGKRLAKLKRVQEGKKVSLALQKSSAPAQQKSPAVEQQKGQTQATQKKQRHEIIAQRRKVLDPAEMLADAERRAVDFERQNAFVKENAKMYTGGKAVEISLKTYYREFRKVVDAADVVIQVLDARDPLGSRCTQVEDAVKEGGANKQLILLLNKIDLIPKENAEEWIKYLNSATAFSALPFKASTQDQKTNLSRSKVSITVASDDLRSSSVCLGAETLVKVLGNMRGSRHQIAVGIVGFPNTGKSSVINSLKRSKACNTGATPGVTKQMQTVMLDKHIQMLDSPGVVMVAAETDAQTILRNCVAVETIDPVPIVAAILTRCSKPQMMEMYQVGDYSDSYSFLALLAKRRGHLRKGGVPDVEKAGKTVLQDWNKGKIRYFTHVPEVHEHIFTEQAQLVQTSTFSSGFNLDDMLANDKEEQDMEEASSVIEEAAASGMAVDMEAQASAEALSKPDQSPEVLPNITIDAKSKKQRRKEKKEKKTVSDFQLQLDEAAKRLTPEMKLKGNRQLNKEINLAKKKMKKLKKKNGKRVDDLTDIMENW